MWDTLYRPVKFSDVLGQSGAIQLLKARLKARTAFDSSYVFSGPYGMGKTTLSRIYARAMLCMDLNTDDPEPCNVCDNCKTILQDQPGPFTERDAASNGSVDHVRKIVDELAYALDNAPKRIYLFDESHRMSVAAQDALLKPIEEKKLVCMLCTTEGDKIRGAIRSRCEEYVIKPAPKDEILSRIKDVLTEERVVFSDDAIKIVIDHSKGHVRDILNKLEMISQLGPVTVDAVRSYLHLTMVSLYYEILNNLENIAMAMELIDKACSVALPEEVSAGIADAAMNCYRMANGIPVDLSVVEPELAIEIAKKYGSGVARISQHFANCKRPTQLSLSRDLVLWSMPSEPVQVEAPLKVLPVVQNKVEEKYGSLESDAAKNFSETEKLTVSVKFKKRSENGKTVDVSGSSSHREMTPEEWASIFKTQLAAKATRGA